MTDLDLAVATALAQWTVPGLYFSLHLELDGLRTIDADVAEALGAWRGAEASAGLHIEWDYYSPESSMHLTLNGLETLEPAVARALVLRWQVSSIDSWMHLELNGVERIHDDGLRFLAPPSGRLHLELNGLRALTPALAEMLVAWPSSELELSGLQTLDAQLAATLASYSGGVMHLDGLSTLDAASARALVRWEGRELTLDGVTQLDVQTAVALASWNLHDEAAERRIRREISMMPEPEMEAVEEEVDWATPADKIATRIEALYDRDLSLRGLDSPEPKVQAALARWHGTREIALAGSPPDDAPDDDESWYFHDLGESCELTTLDEPALGDLVDAARRGDGSDLIDALVSALSAWENIEPGLLLSSDLSPGERRVLGALLASAQGHLLFDAGAGVDAEMVAVLNLGELVLTGLTELDSAQARALASWDGYSLRLDDLTTLSPAVAAELAAWPGSELYLNGLPALDEALARALAGWGGDKLELDGVRSLRPRAARALAGWGGSKLELDGVAKLDRETAKALAGWGGSKLELDGLATLDLAVAQALVRFGGEKLELDGLTYFSEATAHALDAGSIPVFWDGQPISFNTGAAGMAVPERVSQATSDLVGAPRDSFSLYFLDGLRGVGETLRPRRARALAALKDVRELDLDSLTSLDLRSARTLAKWSGGQLFLNGLSAIDAASADALAAWPGHDLHLRGLRAMDEATVDALLSWPGQLHFDSYTLVSPASVDALTGLERVDIGPNDPNYWFQPYYLEIRL